MSMDTLQNPSAHTALAIDQAQPLAAGGAARAWLWLQGAARTVAGRVRTAWRPSVVWLGAQPLALQDTDVQDRAVVAFGQWCQAHPGHACEVALSAQWLLSCVTPPHWSREAMRQHAQNQWSHYHDVDAQALQADWLVRQVTSASAGLLCAVPQRLVTGLQHQASVHGVQLSRVQPWWAQGLQHWLAQLADADHATEQAPGDAAEGLHRLALREPGLSLQIEATVSDARETALTRMAWMTGHEAQARHAMADVLTLPVPDDAAGDARWPGVWDHAALRDVVSGRAKLERTTP
jgi:hypothetical protein